MLELWDESDLALRSASVVAGLMNEVHPDAAVRTLAEHQRPGGQPRPHRPRPRPAPCSPPSTPPTPQGSTSRRPGFRERVLRDFRRSGVDRSEDDRARLREIAERLTVLDQDFARLIRDDVRTVSLPPEALDGLPARLA